MNTLKMTALMLSVLVVSGALSGCSRTHVRTEERPYGQSYVKESPEEKVKTYTEEVKRNAAGEVEKVKEKHIKESGEKTSHDLNPYNRPKNEAYSKEEIHKEQKTEHGRT